MVEMRGTVNRVIFRAPDTGYCILSTDMTMPRTGEYTVKGYMHNPKEGARIQASGDFVEDKKWGLEFNAGIITEFIPASEAGMLEYLMSKTVKGISSVLAGRIVKRFGKDTYDIFEKDPDRLLEVNGIGPAKLETIKASWNKNRQMRNLSLFLSPYGIPAPMIAKIYRQYGERSITTVRENPYKIADDIYGIGFRKADEIALKLGFEKNSPFRCMAGVRYILHGESSSGHIFLPQAELVEKSMRLLGTDAGTITDAIDGALSEGRLVREEGRVYLPYYHRQETEVAEKLSWMISAGRRRTVTVDVGKIEKKLNVEYDGVQARGIQEAVNSPVMVLTGGPGTGKSTTLNGIMEALIDNGMDRNAIRLAAPTGRAAKRMEEVSGMTAVTIHRLLEYVPDFGFRRDEDNPIDGDVLVVDEASMIDITLMNDLLSAVPVGMKLILVGDVDQLPSVGPGNVLRDIIASGTVPVVRLTKIFRQSVQSGIVRTAHMVNNGTAPVFNNHLPGQDMFMLHRETPEDTAKEIEHLVTDILPRHYNMKPQDIMVLAPMKKGSAGTENLNRILQDAVNPAKEEETRGDLKFRTGDKVMQVKNNYDKEIFNGDIGFVTDIITDDEDDDDHVIVRFQEKYVRYDFDELDQLIHAYACTIHKSQGSEYPVVVMAVCNAHYVMLKRNLLYTGITRAKKACFIVGNREAVRTCVYRQDTGKRNTTLKERLISERGKNG